MKKILLASTIAILATVGVTLNANAAESGDATFTSNYHHFIR